MSTTTTEATIVDQNIELYAALRADDPTARQRMIEANMGLVERRVAGFIRKVPSAKYLEDDLLAAGYAQLIEAIDTLALKPDCENPSGYLSEGVRRGIDKHFDEETAVRLPQRTRSRANSRGTPIILDIDSVSETDMPPVVPDESIDYFDELLACCETELEKSIIRTQLDLFRSDCPPLLPAQLMQVFGLKRSRLYEVLQIIRDRYEERKEDWPKEPNYCLSERRGVRRGWTPGEKPNDD